MFYRVEVFLLPPQGNKFSFLSLKACRRWQSGSLFRPFRRVKPRLLVENGKRHVGFVQYQPLATAVRTLLAELSAKVLRSPAAAVGSSVSSELPP